MKSKVLQKEIVDEGRVRITHLQEKLPINYKNAFVNRPTLHGWLKGENCPHHSVELNKLDTSDSCHLLFRVKLQQKSFTSAITAGLRGSYQQLRQ